MSGCVADHDRLCEALEAYEAGPAFWTLPALVNASARCGRPEGFPSVDWSRRRVATYRAHIAQVSGLVAHLNNIITTELGEVQ